MIRQEGGQWCLFTEDGSRKLGCHATEDEAKAQEAGIKAKEAAGRTGVDLLITLGEISLTEDIQVLDNGDVVKSIPLTETGKDFVNGGRKFDITPETVAQAIANFHARGSAPIPITIGHVDDSGAPAAGWINDIFAGDDGRPWGKVQFLKDTWADIAAGKYRYFSAEFYPVDVDQKGNEIGFQFDGGAILNKPFFPIRVDQGKRGGAVFTLSRIRTSTTTKPTSDRGTADGDGGAMTDEEKKAKEAADKKAADEKAALERVHIEGDKVTLSREQYNELAKVRTENAALRGQVEEGRSRNQANEQRITQLERTSLAGRIRNAVKTLQRDHRIVVPLADFAIDSSESECLEWLATAPMGVTTIEGLEKLAKDQEATAHLPRIPGGKEVSGGSDVLPPADLTTEAGRSEAVRRRAAQLKREFSKDELQLTLRRRHQTLEEYAAMELASEHPEYRKELQALGKK